MLMLVTLLSVDYWNRNWQAKLKQNQVPAEDALLLVSQITIRYKCAW
jgi:hypothetical protein